MMLRMEVTSWAVVHPGPSWGPCPLQLWKPLCWCGLTPLFTWRPPLVHLRLTVPLLWGHSHAGEGPLLQGDLTVTKCLYKTLLPNKAMYRGTEGQGLNVQIWGTHSA